MINEEITRCQNTLAVGMIPNKGILVPLSPKQREVLIRMIEVYQKMLRK